MKSVITVVFIILLAVCVCPAEAARLDTPFNTQIHNSLWTGYSSSNLSFSSESGYDTYTEAIYGCTVAKNTPGGITVERGDSFTVIYTLNNTGNMPDTFAVRLNASYSAGISVPPGLSLQYISDSVTDTASVLYIRDIGEDSWAQFSMVVSVPSDESSVFPGSSANYAVSAVSAFGGGYAEYTGDNGFTYAEGGSMFSDTVAVSIAAPDIYFDKSVDTGGASTFLGGSYARYRLLLSNNGNYPADTAWIIEQVPAGMVFAGNLVLPDSYSFKVSAITSPDTGIASADFTSAMPSDSTQVRWLMYYRGQLPSASADTLIYALQVSGDTYSAAYPATFQGSSSLNYYFNGVLYNLADSAPLVLGRLADFKLSINTVHDTVLSGAVEKIFFSAYSCGNTGDSIFIGITNPLSAQTVLYSDSGIIKTADLPDTSIGPAAYVRHGDTSHFYYDFTVPAGAAEDSSYTGLVSLYSGDSLVLYDTLVFELYVPYRAVSDPARVYITDGYDTLIPAALGGAGSLSAETFTVSVYAEHADTVTLYYDNDGMYHPDLSDSFVRQAAGTVSGGLLHFTLPAGEYSKGDSFVFYITIESRFGDFILLDNGGAGYMFSINEYAGLLSVTARPLVILSGETMQAAFIIYYSNGRMATDYSGTLTVSSDSGSVSPPSVAFTGGAGEAVFTFSPEAGTRILTFRDSADPLFTDTVSVRIMPQNLNNIALLTYADTLPFDISFPTRILLKDRFGNSIEGIYSDTIYFSADSCTLTPSYIAGISGGETTFSLSISSPDSTPRKIAIRCGALSVEGDSAEAYLRSPYYCYNRWGVKNSLCYADTDAEFVLFSDTPFIMEFYADTSLLAPLHISGDSAWQVFRADISMLGLTNGDTLSFDIRFSGTRSARFEADIYIPEKASAREFHKGFPRQSEGFCVFMADGAYDTPFRIAVTEPALEARITAADQKANYIRPAGSGVFQIEAYDIKGARISGRFKSAFRLNLPFSAAPTPWDELRMTALMLDNNTWAPVKGDRFSGTPGYFQIARDVFSVFSSGYVPVAGSLADLAVYPNPFVPNDGIDDNGRPFDGSRDSGITFQNLPSSASLTVFNVLGEEVFGIFIENRGFYQWDTADNNGNPLSSGVYIWKLEGSGGDIKFGKLMVVK